MQLKPAIAVLSVFLAAPLHADVKETEGKLTGTTAHNWVAESMEIVMGSAGCLKGEVWRFRADHSVTIRKCVDKKVKEDASKWALKEESSLDTVLTIGGEARFYVTFYKKDGASYMLLKTISDSKVDARANKEFRLEQE